ncbi:hypothetical protein GCM10029992_12200 [Glycomyces albus]
MKITGYDLVRVTRAGDSVHVRGAADDGNAAFILADIEYRHLTFEVQRLIWRAVWSAERVAVVAFADVRHAIEVDLAERSGQLEAVERTDADDAAAEAEAFNGILADLATIRQEAGQ